MKNCKVIGFVLLAFMSAAVGVDAPPLTFKFASANVPGAIQTYPGGVNNAGVMVGTYQDKSKAFHGYILNGNKLTTLDNAKGISTTCNNLTANGAIAVVGAYITSSGATVGFLYKSGEFTDVPGPKSATASLAIAINDQGSIVGYYNDTNNATHGFLLRNKIYTTLDVPGAAATVASGINDQGKIVLYWSNSTGSYQSSLYNGKTFKTINVSGATDSFASDINNVGDVTFQWLDSGGGSHGALLRNGTYYKFNYPKAAYTYAGGLNDKNILVGGYEVKAKGPVLGFKAIF